MSRQLRIAKDFTLPLEAVTQTFAVLAKRGVGKSYLASVMTEEMLKAGLHVVVIDPIGVFWGLRASADGQGPGLPITVMGGEHGDVPLEVTAGETIADVVVDGLSAVIDLSGFRKGEQTRFVTDFAERLYHRNREPLHVVMDEADAFAPQKPMRGQERCLGAIEDIVRRGRARGLGVTLVTQRSAVLNKDVLTQAEVLIALRTIAPQDRDAIDAWIKVHGTPDHRTALMESLPSLPVGTAWFWSPGWLDVFRRIQVRRRQTFDSSATPKVGSKIQTPKRLAEVDLEVLKKRIASTIERAKQTDPKELQREIARLRADLARKPAPVPTAPVTRDRRIEVPILKDSQVKQLMSVVDRFDKAVARISEVGNSIALCITAKALSRTTIPPIAARPSVRETARETAQLGIRLSSRDSNRAVRNETLNKSLGKAERLILSALAQYPNGRTVTQVALLTGYARDGGAFRNALGALRSAGLIEGKDLLRITDGGRHALGDKWEPLPPPGKTLLRHWTDKLDLAESEIIRVLGEHYPKSMTHEEIASITESSSGEPYAPDGGGFRNALGRLRTLELVTGRNDALRLSDDLVG